MKRVAIPVLDGKLSEDFGACTHVEVFDLERQAVRKHQILTPPCRESSLLLAWIAGQGITDVIANHVDPEIAALFSMEKISLFVGVAPRSPDLLVADYLNGTLTSDREMIRKIIS